MTRPQLEEILLAGTPFTPRSRAVITWRVLGRLQRRGLVKATGRQLGGIGAGSSRPAYYLTPLGMRHAAAFYPDLPRRRPAIRGAFLLAHSLLANEVELALRRSARESGDELVLWEPDWQIAMQLGEGASVVPDARFIYRSGERRLNAFVEVDLGTEGTRFFAKKIPRYVDLYRSRAWQSFIPVFPLVLTVTPTDARAHALFTAATAALRYQYLATKADDLFCFISIDDLRAGDALRAPWRITSHADRRSILPAQHDAAVKSSNGSNPSRASDASTMRGGRSGAGSEEDVTAPREPSEVDGPAR